MDFKNLNRARKIAGELELINEKITALESSATKPVLVDMNGKILQLHDDKEVLPPTELRELQKKILAQLTEYYEKAMAEKIKEFKAL